MHTVYGWSSDQLAAWVRVQINSKKYDAKILEKKIDGKILVRLAEDESFMKEDLNIENTEDLAILNSNAIHLLMFGEKTC